MDEEQKVEVEKQKNDRNFLLIFCGLMILISLFFLSMAAKIGLVSGSGLGPGAFPFLVFIIMIGLALWLAIQVFTGKGSSAKLSKHITLERIKMPLFLYARIFIAVLLLQFIGFMLSMMLFTFVEVKFFSPIKLKLPFVVACSIIIPLVIYFGFSILNISLPSPAWLPF
jgi:hypothetical protein